LPNRQESRSEETKRAIVDAARQLFAERGFDAVTMREIAKKAGCSHTTIYIYFKDKDALLHQLSMGPLKWLHRQMEAVLKDDKVQPKDRLKSVTREFIQFCLGNRNMFTIFFMVKASRVDEEEPQIEIQRLRNQLFGLLRQAVQNCLDEDASEDYVLACARIYFFTLHGILGTYFPSEEPVQALLSRLEPTFELTTDVLVEGFVRMKQKEDEEQ
jgi:AcrR family transcriptional regulator